MRRPDSSLHAIQDPDENAGTALHSLSGNTDKRIASGHCAPWLAANKTNDPDWMQFHQEAQ
jgi:hypothetical protein